MGVDDTLRRHLANRLVALKKLFPGLIGIGLVAYGVGWQFGVPFGLITAGGLLIVDTLT